MSRIQGVKWLIGNCFGAQADSKDAGLTIPRKFVFTLQMFASQSHNNSLLVFTEQTIHINFLEGVCRSHCNPDP